MAVAHFVLAGRRQTGPIRSHAYHLCIFCALLAVAILSVHMVAREGEIRMGHRKALRLDCCALVVARYKSRLSRIHAMLAVAISSVCMVARKGEIGMGETTVL